MNHLRLVVENTECELKRSHLVEELLTELVQASASRYYRRVSKPSAPRYIELDDETQEEYRKHVRPIVLGALEDAICLGIHHEGTRL